MRGRGAVGRPAGGMLPATSNPPSVAGGPGARPSFLPRIFATSAVDDWSTNGRCGASPSFRGGPADRANTTTGPPSRAQDGFSPYVRRGGASVGPTGGPTNLTLDPVGTPFLRSGTTRLPRRFRPTRAHFRDSPPCDAVAASRRPTARPGSLLLGSHTPTYASLNFERPVIGPAPGRGPPYGVTVASGGVPSSRFACSG